MHATEVLTVVSPLLQAAGPTAVLTAQTKQSTVVAAEVGNARIFAAEGSAAKTTTQGVYEFAYAAIKAKPM